MIPSISHPTNLANFSEVTIGELTIWFSYSTPIALHTPESGTIARENDWSATTGKHLAHIERERGLSKSSRLPSADFERVLEAHSEKFDR